MLKARIFIGLTLTLIILQAALIIRGRATLCRRGPAAIAAKQELVRALGLTDLSIWTEARYTRHPSQADFFAPFQDLPLALDHFPAGSIVPPPFKRAGSLAVSAEAPD